MAENWYYVQNGNRQGPVDQEIIISMISKQDLKPTDFVWKKGFDNWKKIKEVAELQASPGAEVTVAPESFPAAPVAVVEEKEISLSRIDQDDHSIFIRVGNDRGEASSDYGPFSLQQLKKLYKENRINGKTFIFKTGMRDWKVMGDLPDYQEIFGERAPVIKDSDRRLTTRKPFIAKLVVQNNKKIFEGLCRDISIGGMQVLVNDFKGLAGDKISINIHPENTDYNFSASGTVVRILEGNCGFSFRFQTLSDDAKRAIEKHIQEN